MFKTFLILFLLCLKNLNLLPKALPGFNVINFHGKYDRWRDFIELCNKASNHNHTLASRPMPSAFWHSVFQSFTGASLYLTAVTGSPYPVLDWCRHRHFFPSCTGLIGSPVQNYKT
jgi:hypothetical protein